jgi:hypothetical protein
MRLFNRSASAIQSISIFALDAGHPLIHHFDRPYASHAHPIDTSGIATKPPIPVCMVRTPAITIDPKDTAGLSELG